MNDYRCDDALRALLDWLPEDATLIPLKRRQKRPLLSGWTRANRALLEDPEYRAHFEGETGIGLLCGEASGGLCLVDVDDDQRIDWAEERLPVLAVAPRVRGARGAKWLVRCAPETCGTGLWLAHGERIGELLATRQQGVLAGIHPQSERPFYWDRQGDVPSVDLDDLGAAFYWEKPWLSLL